MIYKSCFIITLGCFSLTFIFGVNNYYTIITIDSNMLFSSKAKDTDLVPQLCQLALLWSNVTICTCHSIHSGTTYHCLKTTRTEQAQHSITAVYTGNIYIATEWHGFPYLGPLLSFLLVEQLPCSALARWSGNSFVFLSTTSPASSALWSR